MSEEHNSYRPRKRTCQEEDAETEFEDFKRESRRARTLQRPTTTVKYSSSGMFSYRDFVYASRNSASRAELDDRLYRTRLRLPTQMTSGTVRVLSLTATCIAVVAENWNDPTVLDGLAEEHRIHAPAMLTEIARRTSDGVVPFKAWAAFSQAVELPLRRRTYRGLVVDDKLELEWLHKLNIQSSEEWAALQAGSAPNDDKLPRELYQPCFFLGMLDLSSHTTFDDTDMWRLRHPLASFLVLLKLPASVTDSALSTLGRNIGDHNAPYERLEVLTLQGATGVTDKAALQVCNFSSLRMLDLRGTSATSQFPFILNRRLAALITSSISAAPRAEKWRKAVKRHDLGPDNFRIEFELFGPSFTPSLLLTKLHDVANWHILVPPAAKPVSVLITSISRDARSTASPQQKSSSDLYAAQLAFGRERKSNAVYHRTYGAVTSSKPIAKSTLDEDEEKDDKSAYRTRSESVAAGWVVDSSCDGQASLYSVGLRKFTKKMEDDSISDWGSEGEQEKEEIAEKKVVAGTKLPSFYQVPAEERETKGKRREIQEALPSDLILLRHLPVRPPHRRPSPLIPLDQKPIVIHRHLEEGGALKKKKPETEDRSLSFFPRHRSSSPSSSNPSLPQSVLSSTTSSALESNSTNMSCFTPPTHSILPQNRSLPTVQNPFAKPKQTRLQNVALPVPPTARPFATGETRGPGLKRSQMTAFRR